MEADVTAAVPPIGAVDWPSISDCTEALNVPVMLLILVNSCVSTKMRKVGLNSVRELGGKCKSRVLRLGCILKAERLEPNEANDIRMSACY